MNTPIELTSDDPILKTLSFKPHRNMVERRYERFLPAPGEPERLELATPWGESLTAKPGDYLVSELDNLIIVGRWITRYLNRAMK